MRRSTKSIAFAALTILFWSTVATAFKISLQHCTIPQLLFVASLTSFLFFGIMVPTVGYKAILRQKRSDIARSALMGLLNPFLYYLVLFKAYSLLPAQVAQPLNQIWPLVLALLAVPLLKQHLPKRTLTSLAICFIGVTLISSQGHLNLLEGSNPIGVSLAIFSSLIWSIYWIVNLKDSRPVVVKLFTNFGFSVIYLLLLSSFIDGFYQISTAGILSSVYVGLFEMGISFFFWMKAMEYAKSAAKLGLMIYLIPFISLFFIHFFAHEAIKPTTIVGLCLIVAGILYQQKNLILPKNNR